MYTLISLILLFISTNVWSADPPLTLYDQGTRQGVVFEINCGSGLTCSKSGIRATLTGSGGSGTPGGSSTQLQYNNSGAFAGVSGSGVDSNGNVGIGSTAPNNPLTVNGKVCIGSCTNISAPTNGLYVSGNVGLGTHIPVSAFHLKSNGSYLTIQQSASGSIFNGINLTDYNGSTDATFAFNQSTGEVRIGGVTSSYFPTFYSNNAESARFNTSGNLGIGSTNPGKLLDVAGDIRIRGVNSQIFGDDNKAFIQASATTTPDLKFLTNSVEVMRITNGGNIGIGTAVAPVFLQMQKNQNGLTEQRIVNVTNGTSAESSLRLINDSTNGHFVFELLSSGYTDVAGWANAGVLRTNVGAGNLWIHCRSGDIKFSTATDGTTGFKATLTNAGNFGIGTATPGKLLDVAGAARINGSQGLYLAGDNRSFIAASATSTADVYVSTNLTQRLTVSYGGNVGIGSTAPGAGLDLGTATTAKWPAQKATTGTRYLCIDTAGTITSSASACSGT